jgi:hypothetical protein
MNSNSARIALGLIAVAAAVVLLVVLAGGESEDETNGASREVPVIVVKGGGPVGGVRELTYEKGDRIRFKVESDVGDEIHVHGYNLTKDVEAGGSVSFSFPATIEGVFEAELEDRGEQIIELTVNP